MFSEPPSEGGRESQGELLSPLSSRNKVHLRQTSKTFPGQCGASLEAAICHLETVARVQARDLEGNLLHCGGDPLTAEVVSERGADLETSVTGLLQYK